ncbi:MAG: GNAT family N-acetyltransferase [Chitinophagaceae bacterium]|nr:MAG: GNAT family N-acetyltransferase [Chitinophagaceae bacterium]
MNLSIRLATKDDAVLIADISRKTFYDTFAADNSKEDMDKFLSEQFTRGRLILEVGAEENIFLLAYIDGAVAGYVKLREGKQPVEIKAEQALEIARLYVLEEFIGHKVGAALMKESIAIAKEKGKELMWLGVWEKNQRAIDFYQRWGFEKFSECDFLLGDDVQRDWLMKKNLTG